MFNGFPIHPVGVCFILDGQMRPVSMGQNCVNRLEKYVFIVASCFYGHFRSVSHI